MLSTKARWVFCDQISVQQVKYAMKSVPWSVEIIVFNGAEGCTNIDELFEDDGTGKVNSDMLEIMRKSA